jgi:predicted nucleotidyltransferase
VIIDTIEGEIEIEEIDIRSIAGVRVETVAVDKRKLKKRGKLS